MTTPVSRVIQKLDSLLEQKDFDAAEKHLEYWASDAKASGDLRALLTISNEQIGFYRKTGKEREALACAEKALKLAEELGLSDSIAMGTTLVNAATAYKAFDHADKALPLYEKAKSIYESQLNPDDGRLGGLYNNMALAMLDLRRFDEAKELFEKALAVMAKVSGGEAEMAITYCNMADLCSAQGDNDVHRYLEKAFELLSADTLTHEGYYAFVCEKCAPTFAHYGYPYCERDLLKRARKIYEGS